MSKWRRKRPSAVLYVQLVLLTLSVVTLMLLGLGIVSLSICSGAGDDSLLAGGHRIFKNTIPLHMKESAGKEMMKRDPWTDILSWSPRISIYHNFLSKEECEHLINVGKPHMTKSFVVDDETGEDVESSDRTSTGVFLEIGQDAIISDIERRIADYTHIPLENGEGLHILHYEVGQKYEPHYDYFEDRFTLEHLSQRIATVLVYLSDVEEGGETVFPLARGDFSSLPGWDGMSDCAKAGLPVKPKMGDALLFWNLNPDATLDTLSLHGACPVIRGNKWSATKWLHVTKYIEPP